MLNGCAKNLKTSKVNHQRVETGFLLQDSINQ